MSEDASTYTPGFGSQLFSSPDGESWTAIAQTVDLDSPESQTGKIKITNNDSPGNSQEYQPGLIDPGDFDFHIVYKPAVQAPLYAAQAARTVLFWKEIFPDSSGWTFKAFITKLKDTGKTENDAIKADISMALTTAAVFVADSLS